MCSSDQEAVQPVARTKKKNVELVACVLTDFVTSEWVYGQKQTCPVDGSGIESM